MKSVVILVWVVGLLFGSMLLISILPLLVIYGLTEGLTICETIKASYEGALGEIIRQLNIVKEF